MSEHEAEGPNSTDAPSHPTLARSASLLTLGNIASRILGLVREMVIAAYFGASGQVSAFRVAAQTPSLIYDFLIGGMLSAALVPVLSDYAQRRDRRDFISVVGMLVSLFGAVLAGLVVLLVLAAPWLARLLAAGFGDYDATLLPLTTQLIRLMAPAVWLFSMAGLLMAVLYAQHRFSFPALATSVYNLGLVLSAPLLASRMGIHSLALGVLAGSLAQFSVMLWDVRRANVPFHLHLVWRHPALAKILRLYAPIAVGLVVALFQVGLDRRLASGAGEQSIAWMAAATTLQQMPLGLISVALALAALPSLSQYFAAGDEARFRATLGRGLRMVLLLTAPAAVGLWLLGQPVTRLLFERGQFQPADTDQVVRALGIYLIGMVFAAIDFPLNYAFYARHNTLLPAVVGVISVAIYVVVALGLLERLGYLGLVWADTAKQAGHALIMLMLLVRQVGRLGAKSWRGVTQVCAAAAAMAGAIWLVSALLIPLLPGGALGDLLLLLIAGGSGVISYLALLHWLAFDELRQLLQSARQALAR